MASFDSANVLHTTFRASEYMKRMDDDLAKMVSTVRVVSDQHSLQVAFIETLQQSADGRVLAANSNHPYLSNRLSDPVVINSERSYIGSLMVLYSEARASCDGCTFSSCDCCGNREILSHIL